MLILTRKLDEAILIGDDIRITIVEIQGDKVKLGIEAPGSWLYSGKRSTTPSGKKTGRRC